MDVPAATASPDAVRVLNVSRCSLVSLEPAPGSTLQAALQHVTTLQAPFNRLDSLAGLEAFVSLEVLNLSSNAFTVIDATMAAALHRLRYLRVIDLSNNELRRVDLGGGAGAAASSSVTRQSTSGGGGAGAAMRSHSMDAGETPVMAVTSLNLSSNMLTDLPDLRAMPALQILDLDANHIDDVADLDGKLPLLALRSFSLRENRLPTVASAVPLAALAATVRHLRLHGNPFALDEDDDGEEVLMSAMPSTINPSRRGSIAQPRRLNHNADNTSGARANGSGGNGGPNPWWWRPFILWLLPLMETLDLAGFTASEKSVAAGLFRERGQLSRDYLELLNPNRRDDLDSYLRTQGDRAGPPPTMLELATGPHDDEEDDHDGGGSAGGGYGVNDEGGALKPPSAHQTPVARAAAPPAGLATTVVVDANTYEPLHTAEWASHHSTHRSRKGSATTTAAASTVLAAIQQKLRSLSSVVEVLWQHDLTRRTFAAVTIQRYYRGYAGRRDLDEEVRETAQFIRHQLSLSAQTAGGSGGGNQSCSGGRSDADAGGAAAAARRASLSVPCASEEMAKATAPLAATGNSSADIQEVLGTMRSLQTVMTAMLGELDEFRAMSDREQRRAAVTIQRHWRGYAGRREWRQVKAGYDEFVESLEPFVALVQAAGRGYVVRRAMRADVDGRYETRRLRGEVASLRAEMAEMLAALGLRASPLSDARRLRMAEYGTDPERAMDDIIARRAHGNSATVSVLDEGDFGADYSAKDTPMRGASLPGSTPLDKGMTAAGSPSAAVNHTPTPMPALSHSAARRSAPLRPGQNLRDEPSSSNEQLSQENSDGDGMGQTSPPVGKKRIVKRRPSAGEHESSPVGSPPQRTIITRKSREID